MARELTQLYAATTTAGGNLDSGILETARYDQLFVSLKGSGATSAACSLFNVNQAGTVDPAAMNTVASVAAGAVSYALSIGYAVGGVPYPVPPRCKVTVTGATTSVVTCEVWGIRFL